MPDRPDIPRAVSVAAFRAAGVKLSSVDPPSPQTLGEAVDAALQAAAPDLRKQGAEEERERLRKAMLRLTAGTLRSVVGDVFSEAEGALDTDPD